MDDSGKAAILSIDIGGSRIKATILTRDGEMMVDYQKIETPASGKPEDVIQAIKTLTQDFPDYNKVSVGFPGYVRYGVVHTAPNLGSEKWKDVPLGQRLANELQHPVRMVNDADMQGLGVISGNGLEMMVTLGTGFGTALIMDGTLFPNLELAHHPITGEKTYDQYIGDQAMLEVGEEKWNIRMQKIISTLKVVFNYDHLYLGGGNSKKITFDLDKNISLVKNRDGIKGGAKLWAKDDALGIRTVYPVVSSASRV